MKKTRCIIVFLVVGVLFAVTHSVASDMYSFQSNATGDWGGARTKLHNAGVDLGLNYTTEPAAAVSGGYDQGSTYLHNINFEVGVDLDKLVGLPKTTFLAKYSSRSGDSVSEDYVVPPEAENGRYVYGPYISPSQEVYGGQTTKLVNFQLTTRFSDVVTVDYGRLVMNDLYLRSNLYCNFMSNTVCGSPKGVFTPYALSAYPDATAGIHSRISFGNIDLKLGVFDGGWAEQDSNGWDWELGNNGVAYAGEIQFYGDRQITAGAEKVIKAGINYNSGNFPNYMTGEETEATTSVWLLADWPVYVEEQDSSQGLAMFGSLIVNSDEEIAALPLGYVIGMVYQGLIPTRDRDKFALMASGTEHSEYNTYTHDFVEGNERGLETVIEMTYNFIVGYGLEIMPSLQYISNPNGSEDFSDATVLGLKLSLSL